jgi:hypothetical protein
MFSGSLRRANSVYFAFTPDETLLDCAASSLL